MHGLVKTVVAGSLRMDYAHFGRGKKTLVMLPGVSVQSVMGAADAVAEAVYPTEVFEWIRGQLVDVARTVTEEDLRWFAIQVRVMRGFDVTNALGNIACPVLVSGSADDRVLGGDGTLRIAECFAGRQDFKLHMYESCGHVAYDVVPDYKERLLRFFVA